MEKPWKHIQTDALLRSGLERQFEIIGEALKRLDLSDPKTAEQISNKRRITGFRNILSHGYDIVENTVVWGIVIQNIPSLLKKVTTLLES